MKKLLFHPFILVLLFSQSTVAQTVFGETFNSIEHRLQQDTNLLPHLANRLAQADTSLRLEQLSLLYYGTAIGPNYDPKMETRILDAANSLGRRQQYDQAVSLLDHFLKNNPGSLAGLLERAYTAWLMEDSLGTVSGYKKYYALLEVPLNSGTGKSAEEAFVLGSLRDIELIADRLGYFIVRQSLTHTNGNHIYQVQCATEADPQKTTTLYFNVNLPLRN